MIEPNSTLAGADLTRSHMMVNLESLEVLVDHIKSACVGKREVHVQALMETSLNSD